MIDFIITFFQVAGWFLFFFLLVASTALSMNGEWEDYLPEEWWGVAFTVFLWILFFTMIIQALRRTMGSIGI